MTADRWKFWQINEFKALEAYGTDDGDWVGFEE
jgi:hypothetical protein